MQDGIVFLPCAVSPSGCWRGKSEQSEVHCEQVASFLVHKGNQVQPGDRGVTSATFFLFFQILVDVKDVEKGYGEMRSRPAHLTCPS